MTVTAGTVIYQFQGLRVESGIEIPEWALFESTDRDLPADVTISIRPDFDVESTPAESDDYRFFAKGVGWFVVRRGIEIIVATERSPLSREIRLLLIGSAWGALMYQRSLLILHASAILTDRGAVLFCGSPGQGKSTLAAVMATKGYQLVSDDICRVTGLDEQAPAVYPSLPVFKLWADSTRYLELNTSELSPGLVRPEKFFYSCPGRPLLQPVPLRAVFLLEWGPPLLIRLRGFPAVERTFRAATWRGGILISAGKPVEYFRQCATMVDLVPVWEFRRPRDFSAANDTTDFLIEHLRQHS